MERYFTSLGLIALAVFLYMTFWYLRATLKGRDDLADQAWGLGFVMIAVLTSLINRTAGSFLILLGMVAIWGLRLFWHIFLRHRRSTEDKRYTELVDKKKSRFFESFLKVFMLQGLLMFIIALSIINFGFYNGSISSLGFINWAGFGVWIVGFIFESVGDRQLRAFITMPENKGKLMTEGLWRYTRHPNYFGEILMWWGIFMFSYQSQFLGLWLISVVSPLLISYLLIFVSGIPMAEKRYLDREDFQRYAKATNALVPWFKKQ